MSTSLVDLANKLFFKLYQKLCSNSNKKLNKIISKDIVL